MIEEEQAELLKFVTRMAAAAESRDLLGGDAPVGAGVAFPPLKRRIRSISPDKAAQAWIARFRALAGPDEERQRAERGGRRTGRVGCRASLTWIVATPAWPVLLSAVLLSGAVAAAVAAATLRYGVERAPEIASVRLGEMTAAYTTRAAAEGKTAEDVRGLGSGAGGRARSGVAESWRRLAAGPGGRGRGRRT